jgi:hypothetical protein
MIKIVYKKFLFNLSHVWFATDDQINTLISSTKDADVIYVHGAKYQDFPFSTLSFEQHSLIKHLPNDETTLWDTFGKHLRKSISRSIREGATVEHYSGTQITDHLLQTCCELYNGMKKKKQLPGKFNIQLAKEYASANQLFISIARLNDDIVGFKASLYDERHSRGWCSAFAFRDGKYDPHAIGRAHQQLEWEVLKYCMTHGITSYDFGGIDSFENPNGIDLFKFSFAKEGQRITYDNYLVGTSNAGKAMIAVYNIYKKLFRK